MDTLPGGILPSPYELSARHVPWLAGCAAILIGAAVPLSGVIGTVSDLYPGALPTNPLFVPAHAFLLYMALPVSVLCLIALHLTPGVLLALILGGSKNLGVLAAVTFGGALLLRTTVHAVHVFIGPASLGVFEMIATEVGMNAALLGLLVVRLRAGKSIRLPADAADRRRALWMPAIVVMMVVLLLPAIFWQDFSGDGIEALQAGQSLGTYFLPRFPGPDSGVAGLGQGMIPPTYVVGWFVSWIGPTEAAARLPLVLTMPLVFAIIADLAEHGLGARLSLADEAGLVAGLAVYLVALGFSASYTPYSADLAAPAATDTVALLCLLAALLFAWKGQLSGMLVFGLLAHLSRPTGLLILGMLAIGALALPASTRRSQCLRFLGAVALCALASFAYDRIYVPIAAQGLGASGLSSSILDRMRYLVFTDVKRVLYAAVPGGILPFLSLFAWRLQDPLARQITVSMLAYFAFFYVQAFIALHHFMPAMVLPMVVFWRMALAGAWRWRAHAALLAASVSLVVSLPRSAALGRSTRTIGQTIAARYGPDGDAWRPRRWALPGVSSLFLLDWDVSRPDVERVGEPAALLYYSTREPANDAAVNYVIQPIGTIAPPGFTAVARDERVVAFVQDTARWRRERFSPPRTDYRARIYDIPRTSMHSFLGVPARAYQLDLAELPGLWRLF
jgi:hypothetical protein